jgi:hypothetical protein
VIGSLGSLSFRVISGDFHLGPYGSSCCGLFSYGGTVLTFRCGGCPVIGLPFTSGWWLLTYLGRTGVAVVGYFRTVGSPHT